MDDTTKCETKGDCLGIQTSLMSAFAIKGVKVVSLDEDGRLQSRVLLESLLS